MTDDEAISVLYRWEKLGKDVWIEFTYYGVTSFFQGVITKCEASYPNNDATRPLEFRRLWLINWLIRLSSRELSASVSKQGNNNGTLTAGTDCSPASQNSPICVR